MARDNNELLFRELVTSKLYGFKHQAHKLLFQFQTVFHCRYYSYHSCSCAFHHEFLDYIGENGTIEQDVFENISQSIRIGKCPHVTNDVPRESVRTTCVNGANIVVAKGDDTPMIEDTDDIQFDEDDDNVQIHHRAFTSVTGIFNVKLHYFALTRQKYLSARYYYEHYLQKRAELDDGYVFFCTQVESYADTFVVKKLNELEAFVHARNEKLLEAILKIRSPYHNSILYSSHRKSIEVAIKYTIKYGLIKLLDVILEHSEPLWPESRASSITWAIMFNNLKALEKLLKYNLAQPPLIDISAVWLKSQISPLFQAFNRPNCRTVLLEYGLLKEDDIKSVFVSGMLLQLMEIDDFRSECFEALQKSPNTENHIDGHNIKWNPHTRQYEWALKWLFGKTDWGPRVTREILKLHIHHNSDLERYKNDVCMGLKYDSHIQSRYNDGHFYQIASQFLYKCDGKEHGKFEQDDAHFALNFLGPFMLECGFNTNRKVLEKSVAKMRLHPAEKVYLKSYVQENFDRPTPLLMLCRKELRRYHKGQSIHKFTEFSNCPKKIKDFIIMRDHISR